MSTSITSTLMPTMSLDQVHTNVNKSTIWTMLTSTSTPVPMIPTMDNNVDQSTPP